MTTVIKVLQTQEMPSDSEACSNHNVISDTTRFFHYNETLNNCDSTLAEGWYMFEINGNPAEIPRNCLRNRLCGTQLPLRLDLGNQALPDPDTTVWAHVCTSYDVLGKWDCCVLRQRAGIRNCGEFYVYYLLPTDRCAVGYCIQEAGNTPSKEYLAITGESVTSVEAVETTTLSQGNDTAEITATSKDNDTTNTTSQENDTADTTTVATAMVTELASAVRARCPQTSAFSCYGGHRTCQNSSSTGVEWIECYHGPGCGIPCDGVPECEDESDERDLNVCPIPVICSEGTIQCPDGSNCYTPCDGNEECDNGFDETGCGQDNIPHEQPFPPSLVTSSATTGSSTISITPVHSSVIPSMRSITSPTIEETLQLTSVSPMTSLSFEVLTSSSAFLTTIAESQLHTTPVSISSQTTTSRLTRLDTISETNELSTPKITQLTTGVQEHHLSPMIYPSLTPVSIYFTRAVDAVSVPTSSISAVAPLSSISSTLFPVSSLTTRNSTVASNDLPSPSSLTGGLVESVTSSSTVTPAIRSITLENTTSSVVTEPIILIFDIIGTAYRNAQERIDEPTFEEILQHAIADVLNEYSNRDRRAVQNFTGEHVKIIHMEKGGENISVSMAINSTKHGEDFIPAHELETLFTNQSAIDALCNEIFGDPITLQTTPVASRPGSMSASILPSYSASRESGIPAATVSSSTTPSVTILPSLTTVNVIKPVSPTVESLTSIETRSFEYETSVSLSPSESVETIEDSSTTVDLEIISTISPADVSASAISSQLQANEPSIFSSLILTTTAFSMRLSPDTYAHIDTLMETSALPYPTDTSQGSSDISQYQSDSISHSITTSTIPLITKTSKSSIYSSMPDIYSYPHSMPDSGSSTSWLQNTPTSLSDQSVIVETIPSVQSSDATVASIESTAVLATGSPSPFTISSSVNAAMLSSPLLVQTDIPSTTVSHAESIRAATSSDITPDSDIATVSPVISPSMVVSTPITLSTVLSSHVDSSSVVGGFEPSTEHTLTPPLPGLEPSSAVGTSKEELSKTLSFSYPHTGTAVEVKPVPTASSSVTSSISPSHTETVQTYPSLTENATSSTLKSTTIHVDTVTVILTTEGNLTLENPVAVEEKLFEKNFGLFIFLIVAGSCMLGACFFVLVAKLYRKRRYTWDPQLAYQDAYADMEKANLSFNRDAIGVESPIPDVDILKGESNELETSLSKASTISLPRTPKSETSQTDITAEPGPSGEPDFTVQSHAISESHDNITTTDSGHENQGFETDTDSGVDGIVPIDEIDTKAPRISFPWMDQLADTKL